MRLDRTALALTAAAALTVSMGTPANAIPNPAGANDDLFTIHLVVPDPWLATRMCTVSYTPTSTVNFLSTGFLVGTAFETGRVKAAPSNCPSVTWTSVVIVKDESPGHPTRTVVGTGSTSASASQSVNYALGVREAGVVTVTMLVSSRLGDFCWADKYAVTLSGNPLPIGSNPC
ncbi:MAG TPA: hypothetical protein VNA20_15670 [Frankiaceae bacterium]|nr:hypothetical protein [Frankiaceae bacterium]